MILIEESNFYHYLRLTIFNRKIVRINKILVRTEFELFIKVLLNNSFNKLKEKTEPTTAYNVVITPRGCKTISRLNLRN